MIFGMRCSLLLMTYCIWLFGIFNLILTGLLDLLAPLFLLKVRQQECPWLSNVSLSTARCLLDVAHHRALKSGSTTDWASYRKLLNTMLRSAKEEHFSGPASSLRGKPAKFFCKHFQSLCVWRSSCGYSWWFQWLFFVNTLINSLMWIYPLWSLYLLMLNQCLWLYLLHMFGKLLELIVFQLSLSKHLLLWRDLSLFWLTNVLSHP